jgi:hypothetical protein
MLDRSENVFTTAWRALWALTAAMRSDSPRTALSPAEVPQAENSLPSSYERTRLVLLAIDPYSVRAYWEVTPETLADAANATSKEEVDNAQAVLRFHDVSLDAPANKSANAFDIGIQLGARNWYVPLWSPGQSYKVELGLKTPSGKFVSLAWAKRVETPRAWPEPAVDEHFMSVSGEERRIEVVSTPQYRKMARAKLAALVSVMAPAISPPSAWHIDSADIGSGHEPRSGRFPGRETSVQSEDAQKGGLAEMAEHGFSPGQSSIIFQKAER